MKFLTPFTLFLFCSVLSFGQKDSTRTKLEEVAREVIAQATHCNLITVDEALRPRVRVMDAFAPEKDFTVWLATNPRSRKVAQLQANPNATLYYLAPDGMSYVMIQGEAELVNSLKMKKKYWKEGWDTFYPRKRKDMLLIKVTPAWMEIVNYAHGVLGDEETWKPAIVKFKQ